MKITQLKNLIRKSIKGLISEGRTLITEQGTPCTAQTTMQYFDGTSFVQTTSVGCHGFEPCSGPGPQGPVALFQSHAPPMPYGTPMSFNPYNLTAGIGSPDMFYQWVGSPAVGDVVTYDLTKADGSFHGTRTYRYVGQSSNTTLGTHGYLFHTNPQNSTCPGDPPSPDVYGCTDPTATNYNPLATIDDGSCKFDSGGDDSFRCLDGNCVSCGGPGCQYPTLNDCEKDCGSRGDDPCAIFYAMPQTQQDGCCEKCQGSMSPADPCYQYCDCCKRDPGGDDPCKTNPNPECFWCSEEGGPGGCQPVGGNLMYAQANGFSLYQNSADCNTAEPGCRREDPVDTCKTNPKDCWFCKSPGNPCIQFSTTNAAFTAGYSGTKYPTSNACNAVCGTGPINDFPVGLSESFIRMQKLANIK